MRNAARYIANISAGELLGIIALAELIVIYWLAGKI
jgi:hypothetical protein